MLKEKCPYFGSCGGCIWQDLSQEEYVSKKENFIKHAFKDAGFDTIPLKPLILIPTGTRRRACFAVNNGHMGFNQLHSHQIIEISSCPLLLSKINAVLPVLKERLKQLKFSGDIFILSTDYGVDIHIKTQKATKLSLDLLENLNQLAQEPTIARLVYNNQPLFEKMPLGAFADTFMQPSKDGEEALIQLMLQNLAGEKTAVDLFCGKGTFTKPLLEHHISAIGYDSVPQAVACLKEHGHVRDLFRSPLTAHELNNIDLAVLDPPRAGALAQIKEIAKSPITKVIMISCNPKTAARDSSILCQAGFKIQGITPVDQFTYSNHIELVIIFEK